jgi:hypothetical protein
VKVRGSLRESLGAGQSGCIHDKDQAIERGGGSNSIVGVLAQLAVTRSISNFYLALFPAWVIRGAVLLRFGGDSSRQCAGDGLRGLRSVGSCRCAALELRAWLVFRHVLACHLNAPE